MTEKMAASLGSVYGKARGPRSYRAISMASPPGDLMLREIVVSGNQRDCHMSVCSVFVAYLGAGIEVSVDASKAERNLLLNSLLVGYLFIHQLFGGVCVNHTVAQDFLGGDHE